MEPNTSSKNLNTSYDDEFDGSNIIDAFVGLDIKKEDKDNVTIVFFSLDRTDRNTSICEILAIAATCRGRGEINEFKVYMKPEKYGIAPSTSKNKGYKIGTDGKLLIGENEVDPKLVASSQKDGLEKFLKFLSDQTRCGTRSVILAAHACDKNRRPVLLRHMAENNLLPDCKRLVKGFIDTCTVIKTLDENDIFPTINDGDFSLKNLAKTYLRLNILRERADVTVQAILLLIDCPAIDCDDELLLVFAKEFNFDAYNRFIKLRRDFRPTQVSDFERTLVAIPDVPPARNKNRVPLKMLQKIANAGISSDMLQKEYIANRNVSDLLETVTTKLVIVVINTILGNPN